VSVVPFSYLTLTGLSDEDAELVGRMSVSLQNFERVNKIKRDYYDGVHKPQMLGIAVPRSFEGLDIRCGWGGTPVDVLEERLQFYGWTSEGDTYGLDDVFQDNALEIDAGLAHLDALIYGTSFVVVGAGDADEPSPLVTVHSPRNMTGLWDARKRRLRAAFSTVTQGHVVTEATLYKESETVWLERENPSGRWVVVDRDQHRLGRVPVVQFENRASTNAVGRSEITAPIRSLADQAVRTMFAMELNREFYTTPQRWAVNVAEDAFTANDGGDITGWDAIQGHMLVAPFDPDNTEAPEAKFGQFSAASPAPFLDQLRGLAQSLCGEAGMPVSYMGLQADVAPSADAIRALESRLVTRAERRQTTFGRSWSQVGGLVLLVRDGSIPDDYRGVSTKWREAATPTRSAAADEALKLTQGDNPILPADSSVTYDRLGLTPAEQRQVAADKRRTQGTGNVLGILNQSAQRVRDERGDAAPVA